MIDLLTVGESRQMTAVAEKIRTALLTAGDIYLLSTFRLPPKQGGVLFGLYSRQDNTRWLEASVVGKINKGDWWAPVLSRSSGPLSTLPPPTSLLTFRGLHWGRGPTRQQGGTRDWVLRRCLSLVFVGMASCPWGSLGGWGEA